MPNNDTLIQQLFQGEQGKWKLRKAFDQFYQQQLIVTQQHFKTKQRQQSKAQDYAVGRMVEELAAMIEQILEKKSEQYFGTMLTKVQEMYAQQEMLFMNRLDDRVNVFRKEFKELLDHSERDNESKMSLLDETTILKSKKKIIGDQLLDCSRVNISHKEVMHDNNKLLENSRSLNFSREHSEEYDEVEKSIARQNKEIEALYRKISEFENRKFKDLAIKLEKKIKLNENDLIQLSEKLFLWKTTADEHFEVSFDGIWNVITNIEKKIMALQESCGIEM